MSTSAQPTCLCPPDSDYQLIAKINNNLVNLLSSMSAGTFKGVFVNTGSCLCSNGQILATLNNNIVNAFSMLIAGGAVDPTIHSWSDLAMIATVALPKPQLKIWVDNTDGLLKATQLIAGKDATNTVNGIQRPNDYNDPTNTFVWYNKLA